MKTPAAVSPRDTRLNVDTLTEPSRRNVPEHTAHRGRLRSTGTVRVFPAQPTRGSRGRTAACEHSPAQRLRGTCAPVLPKSGRICTPDLRWLRLTDVRTPVRLSSQGGRVTMVPSVLSASPRTLLDSGMTLISEGPMLKLEFQMAPWHPQGSGVTGCAGGAP